MSEAISGVGVRRVRRSRISLRSSGYQLWKRFPGALWLAPETETHTSGHSRVMMKHGGQKYRSADQIIIALVEIRISWTTVAD
jgi:hypothetical protein